MSKFKEFAEYVEVKTKITGVFSFLTALVWLIYSGKTIDTARSLVFFAGIILFDLTATAINNYTDRNRADREPALGRSAALAVILILFALSAAAGLWLVILTDTAVLLLGGLCFLFGVLYSYGPVPISHGPLGEVTSGFFYGLLIPFILVYINTPGELLTWSLTLSRISVEINVLPMLKLLLLSAVPFCLTANIMLANNICDVSGDIEVGRHTLAFYLKNKALPAFAAVYYLAYLSVVVMVAAGFLSPLSLLLLFTIIPVQKNIGVFFKKQVKEETFIIAIKNLLIIIIPHIVLILLGGLLPGGGL